MNADSHSLTLRHIGFPLASVTAVWWHGGFSTRASEWLQLLPVLASSWCGVVRCVTLVCKTRSFRLPFMKLTASFHVCGCFVMAFFDLNPFLYCALVYINIKLLHGISFMFKLMQIWFCPNWCTFVYVHKAIFASFICPFAKPALLRTSQWITNKTWSYLNKFAKSAMLLMTCKVKQFLHSSDSDAC